MSVSRFGKSRGRGASPSYRDRAAYALDAQLASLASSGDDSAFTTLVTRFQPAVFRWALMFASDPDEAEDITQEVFVRTYRQLDSRAFQRASLSAAGDFRAGRSAGILAGGSRRADGNEAGLGESQSV